MVPVDMIHNIYRLVLDDKLAAAPLRDPEHALDSKLRLVDVVVGLGVVNSNQLTLCVQQSRNRHRSMGIAIR